jgi:uncharacterized protein YndB with AHSA1/START domain
MVHIHGEIVINRSPEEVFDVVADTTKEPEYNPRMHHAEQITNGPICVGTRFHAEIASMGRPVDMVIEITDYQRPRSLASTTHMSSMNLHGTLTFDPVPDGTRMRWSWHLQPSGALKLLSPLIATMGRRQEQSIWTGLKHHLETRSN